MGGAIDRYVASDVVIAEERTAAAVIKDIENATARDFPKRDSVGF